MRIVTSRHGAITAFGQLGKGKAVILVDRATNYHEYMPHSQRKTLEEQITLAFLQALAPVLMKFFQQERAFS